MLCIITFFVLRSTVPWGFLCYGFSLYLYLVLHRNDPVSFPCPLRPLYRVKDIHDKNRFASARPPEQPYDAVASALTSRFSRLPHKPDARDLYAQEDGPPCQTTRAVAASSQTCVSTMQGDSRARSRPRGAAHHSGSRTYGEVVVERTTQPFSSSTGDWYGVTQA